MLSKLELLSESVDAKIRNEAIFDIPKPTLANVWIIFEMMISKHSSS